MQDAALLGITVLASTGDAGSDCMVHDNAAHVEYPASDPGVTSCGGTVIQVNNPADGSFLEALWIDSTSGSGGGVSACFPLPYWQASAGVPISLATDVIRRGVPDVAGNASTSSGYMLIQNREKIGPIGGTSAVAPLYAGLVALLNANLNDRVGYLNAALYGLANVGACRDVTLPAGQTNGCNGAPGYPVGPGWDAATGLGSINGTALLNDVAQMTRPILWLSSSAGPADPARLTVAVTSGGWNGNGVTWAAGGPTAQQSPATPSLAMFGGRMYMAFISAGAAPGAGNSVLVCSTDKRMNWTTSTTIGSNAWAPSLAVFRGRLYAAFVTLRSTGTLGIALTSTADGVNWTERDLPSLTSMQEDALSLAVFNGQLYLAFLSSPEGPAAGHFSVAVYATADLENWQYVLHAQLNSMFTPSLAVFNGNLYVALSGNDSNLPGILTFQTADGKNWTRGQQGFFGQGVQNGVSLAAVGGRLYAAFIPENSGNAVSLCSTADGQTWTASTSTGFASSVLPALAATTIATGGTPR